MGYVLIKNAVSSFQVNQLLQICTDDTRLWTEGINNRQIAQHGDGKRLFSVCNIDRQIFDVTNFLHDNGLTAILDDIVCSKQTLICQLPFCARQVLHTDYDSTCEETWRGVSVPFGVLLALSPRGTWVKPRSHKLRNQPTITISQSPGDILLMRGDLRHGGESCSSHETYALHSYMDKPSAPKGTAPKNNVFRPPEV